MAKAGVRYGLIALAAVAVLAALALGAAAARLAAGPVAAQALAPGVERLLAAQVEGGQAQVGRVEAVWFARENALGLRLSNVRLKDGAGRPVLRAGQVETAVALDSVALLSPAPARIVADDFFVALSVSPEGAYRLGYEASGAPAPAKLDTLFRSLTGPARRGRSLSYLRRLELTEGVVLMRQVKGPVGWRAAVRRVAFGKNGGRLTARADLAIDDGRAQAEVDGALSGAVGLSELSAFGQVTDLTPSRVFPAAGFARPLSALDAPVRARGRVQYAASRGITSADVSAEAGAGALRAGDFMQRLDGARLVTRYDPDEGKVQVRSFQVDAERTRLDVGGLVWLEPKTGEVPARVRFTVSTHESLLTIAPSAAPQPVTEAVARGEYVPEEGRFEISEARMRVAGAPVSASVRLLRGPDPEAAWGVKAAVDSRGVIRPEQAAAFWPEGLGREARAWFVQSIPKADVTGFRLRADAPPGELGKPRLPNPMLSIAFDFTDASAVIAPTLPRIERGAGSGLVQGDRFDLTMTSGRLLDIALSEGSVEIPSFKSRGARAVFKVRAAGDVAQMLEVVDRKPLGLMRAAGMSPQRFTGRADLKLEISRPMLTHVPLKDYGVRYSGRWEGGGVEHVAGALDLTGGRMAIDGSLEKVTAKGVGRVGPFFGRIDFRSDLEGARAGVKQIKLDGAVDVAGAMAGRPGRGEPLRARISAGGGGGQAVIRSRLLEGRANWRDDRKVLVEGLAEPAAWKAAGLPVGPGLPARMPVKLALGGAGGSWSGSLDADAYSGALTISGGEGLVRYVADIAPAEAEALGLGELPMFAKPRRLVLEAGGAARGGAADYSVAGMAGRVEWGPGKEKGALVYRFQTQLGREDFAGLGVPFGPESPMPVEAVIEGARGGFSGQAKMAGAAVRFAVSPERGGRRQIVLDGEAPAAALTRLGLAEEGVIDGAVRVSGRLERAGDGALAGRLEADLERAGLAVPHSDWRKPAGRKARLYADLNARPGGAVRVDRMIGEGPGLELAASGAFEGGALTRLDVTRLRLDGLFDGKATAVEGGQGLALRIEGDFLDARPLLRRAGRSGRSGAKADDGAFLSIDGRIARVRLSEAGYLKDARVNGGWGRRLTIAASTPGGSSVSARLWPDGGSTAFAFKAEDLGDAARTLAGIEGLRGGEATGAGKLVPGGYDLTLDVRGLRVDRAPALAQVLTVASLQGLADTLAGEGILFTRIEAPVKVRGAQVMLGQTELSGQALGITAKGAMDLDARTLDINGVVAPAYALNSVAGVLPVLGPVLISRKGEGVFGMTYSARGSFDAPRVQANPLSFAAPGVLRRVFEGPAPNPLPETPGPSG